MEENTTGVPSGQTVVVGMSGGVDSSVAALLLRDQGYRVVGLFMRNWEEKDESGQCTAERDFSDVARVCEQLEVPYYSVDFVKEYRDQVFARFLREYSEGHTPNPDVLCNREIKFDAFFKKALELGADFVATGHYCRLKNGRLLKGLDPQKDQSYFLNQVDSRVFPRVLFPIGHLPKSEVREIAKSASLFTHSKKDSTGICFIGERDFREFLSGYLAAQPGEFRTLDGQVVGRHQGSAFYTPGQRKGLGLGGPGLPWYVVAKDVPRNRVYVERGDDHPSLYTQECVVTELNWLAGHPPAGLTEIGYPCRAKARYRQPDQDCVISPLAPGPEGSRVRIRFTEPQRALTLRQFAVFYDGEECLGGGVISELGPNFHEQGLKLPASALQDQSVEPEPAF